MKSLPLMIIGLLCLVSFGVGGQLAVQGEIPVPAANPQTPAKAALGKKLFFDRRLSGDGTMSCSTCHDPKQGFSDGLATSLNYPTTRNWRNSPTLLGVAWQKHLFHDGRAVTLEEQALFPIMSAFEMNQNLDFLEEELRAVPEYQAEFTEVFGDPDITRERIAMAIAAFERTLISRNTPLDLFLAGDENALSPEAELGYQVFIGKGRCTDCHFGATLSDNDFHALNVREHPEQVTDPRIAATRRFVAKTAGFADYRTLEEDPGRYLVSKDRRDWKAFKTPTLRDIVATAPYMHNGIMADLDEVITFFNDGGGEGNTVLQPLHLSLDEKNSLRKFLEEGPTSPPIPFVYPKLP